jgi:hypothetical protein
LAQLRERDVPWYRLGAIRLDAGRAVRGMFERFTDRARRVVVLGQEEARLLNHNYIGTEHLLLGLIHEGNGVAARALEALGISLEAVRQQVEQIIGVGNEAPSGHIPFTPRTKKTLELAAQEADALGQGFIDTEHLLLGLAREGRGVAAQVLGRLGGDPARVRQQVIELAPRRERAWLADAAGDRAGLVDQRLAAIERWVGMAPDLGDLDQEIAHVRREKESAIDGGDFESAAVLRNKEKELVDRRMTAEGEWMDNAGDRLSLAAELGRVNAELERLRDVLRQHGIDGGA